MNNENQLIAENKKLHEINQQMSEQNAILRRLFEIQRDLLERKACRKAVEEFADFLCEYAIACKESGYDGIGAQDIQDKCKEFLER